MITSEPKTNFRRCALTLLAPPRSAATVPRSIAEAVQAAVRAVDERTLHPVAQHSLGLVFQPKAVLALLSYCYAHQIYRSTDIADMLARDVDLHQLCHGELPDALIIREFRRENREAVRLCLSAAIWFSVEQKLEEGVVTKVCQAQCAEEAKRRIDIINAYVTSQNLVIDDPTELGKIKKTAANELYGIKAFLDHTSQSLKKSSEKSDNFLQRFFLLYKMKTVLATFLRSVFFIVLFVSVLWSIFVPSVMFTPTEGIVAEAGDAVINLISSVILVLPVILVAMLVRWLATKFDKPEKETE